jgi:dUTP pyrophosphatase
MNLNYVKTRDVKNPVRGTSQSAGIDFFIPNDFDTVTLGFGDSVCIPAGIKVRIPKGHALIFQNKSGIAMKKNLLVGACVVDEDYQGEVHIDLHNVGIKSQTIEAGDKIVQGLITPINYAEPIMLNSEEDLFTDMDSERGDGGFGSTATK